MDGDTINLIINYGQLTMEEIADQSNKYIVSKYWKAHNNIQTYHCIMNTLTKEDQYKILEERIRYLPKFHPSGPMLFKLITKKATTNTRQTGGKLWDNLSSLDTYMATVGENLEGFNHCIKLNYEGLKTRGEHYDATFWTYYGYKFPYKKNNIMIH